MHPLGLRKLLLLICPCQITEVKCWNKCCHKCPRSFLNKNEFLLKMKLFHNEELEGEADDHFPYELE